MNRLTESELLQVRTLTFHDVFQTTAFVFTLVLIPTLYMLISHRREKAKTSDI